MVKRNIKLFCIVIAILFLLSIAVPVVASCENSKDGGGFKGVARKPGGVPGKPDKPGKPGDDDKEDPSVDKWAVVIGIADYKGKINDLEYTDDDAQDMYDYLIEKGYPKGNIKLLLNRQAKGDAIYAAIEWMEQWEGPGSECVFFYSGHGSTYDGYNDGDTEYTDETIIEYGLRHILDGFLRDAFSSYESQKIAFIFDSCYSGGMDDLAGSNRVVVMACSETELSWDGADWMQNGVFTYYYMEGLYTLNTVEGAFNYATLPAHEFVLSEYSYDMNPVMSDFYPGDWTF